ncbi:MAG: hypothetical protein JSS86_25720 [Cyanobacteria bacterium SZAS LIN-2]|nr:hypothetical protein [Cyanobacteria bacterium SZAS LIN-2]
MHTTFPQSSPSDAADADSHQIHWLSSRIWHGRTVDDLQAMGIQLTGNHQDNYIESILPSGWHVRDSAESPFQKHLVDQDGAIRARLYYQPGSAGGGMEMCIEGSQAISTTA